MAYERVDPSTVELTYWLDNEPKGTGSVAATPYEDDLLYFHASSGDGTVWIDDIKVSHLSDNCPWDLDYSGSVETSDLLALFAQWGTAGPADFDGSGIVGTIDILILFANWGPC